jgi:hypothetical protein
MWDGRPPETTWAREQGNIHWWSHIRLRRLNTCCSELQNVWISDSAVVTSIYKMQVFNKSNYQSTTRLLLLHKIVAILCARFCVQEEEFKAKPAHHVVPRTLCLLWNLCSFLYFWALNFQTSQKLTSSILCPCCVIQATNSDNQKHYLIANEMQFYRYESRR